jgi:hypothetical protein
MTDRENRSDRLRKRFDRGGRDDGDESGSDAGTDADGSNPADADERESVKDRPSVLMYLPEATRQELDIRFDELNARYKREHGEPLEKNRDYYPAVIRAGLEGERVEDVLDL